MPMHVQWLQRVPLQAHNSPCPTDSSLLLRLKNPSSSSSSPNKPLEEEAEQNAKKILQRS